MPEVSIPDPVDGLGDITGAVKSQGVAGTVEGVANVTYSLYRGIRFRTINLVGTVRTPERLDDSLEDTHLIPFVGRTHPGDEPGKPEWQDLTDYLPSADDAVTAETAFGQASAVGTDDGKYARGDHTHGTPTNPVPAHEAASNPHPTYATDADLTAHAAAGDPHTGYRLESADHSHASSGLQGGQVAHSALTGVGSDDHHARSHDHSNASDDNTINPLTAEIGASNLVVFEHPQLPGVLAIGTDPAAMESGSAGFTMDGNSGASAVGGYLGYRRGGDHPDSAAYLQALGLHVVMYGYDEATNDMPADADDHPALGLMVRDTDPDTSTPLDALLVYAKSDGLWYMPDGGPAVGPLAAAGTPADHDHSADGTEGGDGLEPPYLDSTGLLLLSGEDLYVFTGDGDDVPTAGLNVLLLDPDGADRNLTGLADDLLDGRMLLLCNIGDFNIDILEEDSGSTAAHRFRNGFHSNIAPQGSLLVRYSTFDNRWMMVTFTALVSGTPVQIDYGDAASDGTSQTAAASDHQHAVNAKFQEASLTFEFGPNAAVNDFHCIPIPWNFTPQSWTILGDVSGSVTIDLWMDTYANHPPTNADSITASATPAASSSIKAQSSTLTGWDTTWVKGDILKVVIEALTTMTQVTIEIQGIKT